MTNSNILLSDGAIAPSNDFLTQKELAKWFEVSLSTVCRGMRDNLWPYNQCITVGRSVRYSKSLITQGIHKMLAAKQEAAARELGIPFPDTSPEPSPTEKDGVEKRVEK
jgi:hypothetical protein